MHALRLATLYKHAYTKAGNYKLQNLFHSGIQMCGLTLLLSSVVNVLSNIFFKIQKYVSINFLIPFPT